MPNITGAGSSPNLTSIVQISSALSNISIPRGKASRALVTASSLKTHIPPLTQRAIKPLPISKPRPKASPKTVVNEFRTTPLSYQRSLIQKKHQTTTTTSVRQKTLIKTNKTANVTTSEPVTSASNGTILPSVTTNTTLALNNSLPLQSSNKSFSHQSQHNTHNDIQHKKGKNRVKRMVAGNELHFLRTSSVAIMRENETKPWCSGTVISSNQVLTAAHCLTESAGQYSVRYGGGSIDSMGSVKVVAYSKSPCAQPEVSPDFEYNPEDFPTLYNYDDYGNETAIDIPVIIEDSQSETKTAINVDSCDIAVATVSPPFPRNIHREKIASNGAIKHIVKQCSAYPSPLNGKLHVTSAGTQENENGTSHNGYMNEGWLMMDECEVTTNKTGISPLLEPSKHSITLCPGDSGAGVTSHKHGRLKLTGVVHSIWSPNNDDSETCDKRQYLGVALLTGTNRNFVKKQLSRANKKQD